MIFTPAQKFEMQFVATPEVYNNFITTFNDKNPLHTDEQFAAAKGFKGRVIHGNILNGFLSFFIGEGLPTKDVIILSQEIQFKNPVYIGDTLSFSAEVSEVYESVNSIEFKFIFKNEEQKTAAKGKVMIKILP